MVHIQPCCAAPVTELPQVAVGILRGIGERDLERVTPLGDRGKAGHRGPRQNGQGLRQAVQAVDDLACPL